jgi:HlyD family secretion protein
VDGVVTRIGPDASESSADPSQPKDDTAAQLQYKAVIALDSQRLLAQGRMLRLVPGMQVIAEINQGKRTVLNYLLSPLRTTLYDSGRER